MTMKDLVAAARMGDQQAMTQLYEATNRKAYYLAVQLVKDEDQAWDILQDSYVKAFESLDSLADPEKFQSWLNMIVTNKSRDYLRKKKPLLFSQLASEDDEEANVDFEDESGQFSPEAAVDYSETKRLVQEMIDDLSDDQRMAIVLHYMEYCSVKQIAEIMGCSEGTVKSRLNYGRKAIKDKVLLLEKQGTKLYCLPLAPFLYWLFRQQAQSFLFPWEAAALASGAGLAQAGAASASAGAGSPAGVSEAASGAGAAGISGAGTGTGAASASAGAYGAEAAGKAGITILGKVIGLKGAAIAASVCIVAGAGIGGGVYAARHFVSPSSETAVAEAQENDGGEAQDVSQETGYMLTDEERQVLQKIYQAAENRDYEALVRAFQPEFVRLYQMEREHFPDQYIIFDGEDLSADLEGHKLAIRTSSSRSRSTSHGGELRYQVYGYLGDFENGQPEGELLAFRNVYNTWEEEPAAETDISSAFYSQGVTDGAVDTQFWRVDEDGSVRLSCTSSGVYDQEGNPEGEFALEIYDEIPVGYEPEVEVITSGLTFHVQIDKRDPEEFLDTPDSEIRNMVNITPEGGADAGNIWDDSGQYRVFEPVVVSMIISPIENCVLWSDGISRPWHEEGTENELPDGTALTKAAESGGQENAEETAGREDEAQALESQPSDPALMEAYNAAMRYPDLQISLDEIRPDPYPDNGPAWIIDGSSSSYWSDTPSELVDHGDYYEVTNSFIYAPYVVPADVVEQMAPGYEFTVSLTDADGNETAQTFTAAGDGGTGYLELASEQAYNGEADAYLDVQEDGSGLIRSYMGDWLFYDTIYSGSLYFAKDCSVYGALSSDEAFGGKEPITFEEYATAPPAITYTPEGHMTGFQHGNQNGTFRVYGTPVFDPDTGLIVEYLEMYQV